MCVLGFIWAILLFGMVTGEMRVNPRIELFVSSVCVIWFAYWSVTTVRDYLAYKKQEDVINKVKSDKWNEE